MTELTLIMAAVVLVACTVETFSGFAGAMVAITLGAHFYPIERLVPVYVVINLLMNSYLVLRHRGHVEWGLLLKQVLPFMCVGLIVGLWLFPYLEELPLKKILGGLIVVFAGARLLRTIKPAKTSSSNFPLWLSAIWQFLAGVCQAIYATGGPLLVYSLSRRSLVKSAFRATLCTVWGSMNTVLISAFAINGRLDYSALKFTAWLLPALPVGIVLGEWMHGRVSEKQFQLVILLLLLVAGSTLII